jgi:hypothetical protein
MGIKFAKAASKLLPYISSNQFQALMLFLYGEFFPVEDLRHPKTRLPTMLYDPEYAILEQLQHERLEKDAFFSLRLTQWRAQAEAEAAQVQRRK